MQVKEKEEEQKVKKEEIKEDQEAKNEEIINGEITSIKKQKKPKIDKNIELFKNKLNDIKKEEKILKNEVFNIKKEKMDKNLKKPKIITKNKKLLSDFEKEEIIKDVGTRKQILEGFVDRVLERSLYLYRTKNCHTCANLLAQGKSTYNCPKCHHKLEEFE